MPNVRNPRGGPDGHVSGCLVVKGEWTPKKVSNKRKPGGPKIKRSSAGMVLVGGGGGGGFGVGGLGTLRPPEVCW